MKSFIGSIICWLLWHQPLDLTIPLSLAGIWYTRKYSPDSDDWLEKSLSGYKLRWRWKSRMTLSQWRALESDCEEDYE